MIIPAVSYEYLRGQVTLAAGAIPPDAIADLLDPTGIGESHISTVERIRNVPWLPKCRETMTVLTMDNGERWIVKGTFEEMAKLLN